jgi:hypothetical protein
MFEDGQNELLSVTALAVTIALAYLLGRKHKAKATFYWLWLLVLVQWLSIGVIPGLPHGFSFMYGCILVIGLIILTCICLSFLIAARGTKKSNRK